MDATLFLASLWGPAMLAVGFGIFVSPQFYRRVYKDIEKEPLAGLMYGMVGIAVGIVHIQFHNVWETFPQMLVSFLGWATLFKGTVFAIVPQVTDKMGDWAVGINLQQVSGGLLVIMGGYLTWLAYVA